MNQKQLAAVFWLSAFLLVPVSFYIAFAYAGPEPFYEFREADALTFIGLSTAAVALWIAWSMGVLALVIAGVFSRWWLSGLLAAAICIFSVLPSLGGYFYDLEHFMLSPEQQKRIGVPVLESMNHSGPGADNSHLIAD